MELFIVACIGVLIWIAWIIVSSIKQSSDSPDKSVPKCNFIDSQNPPASFSPDMRDQLQNIADYYGVRYVTGAETHKWILHRLSEDFSAMPGWDIWDSSIHEAPGQFDRAERAAMDEHIRVISYDPQYQLAKVRGRTAVYLTSCKRCSCPDYRKRRLPCKHMYALAMELDGNIGKFILDPDHPPLYGLVLALAGHLPKSHNGVGGIRVAITKRGGIWSDNIEFDSSVVVVGNNPSAARLERIRNFDMETLSPESIEDIFVLKDG